MSIFGATAAASTNPNKSIEVQQAPADSVSSLCFSPKANLLVATSWDNQVRCWEVMGSGTNVGTVPKASISHEQPVLCSTWKDDGTTVFSGGCDKQVKMWPLSGNQPVTVAMHDAPVKELAWIPEMNLLVTGSWDKTLRYWDLRQPNPAYVQQLPERCYALTVKHPLMVVGTADRNHIVFNLQNPQTEFKRIVSPLKYQTRCLAAFPDQQGFLVGSIEGRVGVHHLDDSQQGKNFTFKCHREGNEIYSVNSLNFHPVRHMGHLQLRDLMAPSTFGTKIANRGLRQCQDAASPYLAAHSTMMAQSMHMQFVMIGAKVLKIIIHQLQKHTFTCTSHRILRLKASHELELAVESEVSRKASSHHF